LNVIFALHSSELGLKAPSSLVGFRNEIIFYIFFEDKIASRSIDTFLAMAVDDANCRQRNKEYGTMKGMTSTPLTGNE